MGFLITVLFQALKVNRIGIKIADNELTVEMHDSYQHMFVLNIDISPSPPYYGSTANTCIK